MVSKDLYRPQVWLAYLTEWTYIILTVYFCYHALVTLAVYNSCQGLKLKLLKRMDFTEHKYLFRELYVLPTGYQQQANVTDDDPMDIVDRRLVVNIGLMLFSSFLFSSACPWRRAIDLLLLVSRD